MISPSEELSGYSALIVSLALRYFDCSYLTPLFPERESQHGMPTGSIPPHQLDLSPGFSFSPISGWMVLTPGVAGSAYSPLLRGSMFHYRASLFSRRSMCPPIQLFLVFWFLISQLKHGILPQARGYDASLDDQWSDCNASNHFHYGIFKHWSNWRNSQLIFHQHNL